ncbi:unnamed protein product [Calypogeia fissa]
MTEFVGQRMELNTFKEDGPSPDLTRARMFSLRIVHLDYYMAAPIPGMDECYSHFQGRGVNEVPVVRIFGSTTSGQKTCLHLHKAFPYFYVSYDDDLPQAVNEALSFVRRLASAVEKACKIASTMGAKRQHVHSCSLVRGRKYYGYYPNEQLFIKIVLYYPQEVSRMSTLLLSGGIMNHKFQPYEAHIPYLLQILIDYNLYGMGHLHVSSVKFRNPLPQGATNVMSVVKQVKAEFLYTTPATEVEDVARSKEIDAQKDQVDPQSDLSKQQQKKDEQPSTCQGAKLVSPNPSQSTPGAETQQDHWLQGNVPGEWIWPIHSSSQGRQGPYSRQSTCELEADTSVVDILNRSELLFKPLQQTGPEVKMVQSLTPIWEEELLRTGEGGPAGPVNVQYQPTKRTPVPASSLEEAMRDALFQIANAEEHQVKPISDRQDAAQLSDSAIRRGKTTEEPPMQNSDGPVVSSTVAGDLYSAPVAETKVLGDKKSEPSLQEAGPSIPAQGSLLQWTQLANSEVALVSPELENSPKQAALMDDNDGIAINEDAILSHLSQRLQSQDQDKEAVELLRWLGATQTQDADDGIDEQKVADVALSQIFSSPGMDSALLKALEDYESATEQECQAILDCMPVDKEEEEEEEQAYNDADVRGWGQAHFKRDNEGASTSSTGETRVKGLKRKNEQKDNRAFIPQTDGPGDDDSEDEVDHDELFSPSKNSKVDREAVATAQHTRLDGSVRQNTRRLNAAENQDVSLREMMRRRREKRPQKKESSSSRSSFLEDAIEGVAQGSLQERSARVSRQQEAQKTRRKNVVGTLDDQMVQVESRRKSGLLATTTGRKTDKNSDREEKGKSESATDKNYPPKSVKYTALPMVKVKTEDAKLDTPIQAPYERDTENCTGESNNDLSNAEQPGISDSFRYSTESSARQVVNTKLECNENYGKKQLGAIRSGDDRDCGGGDGTKTLARQEIGDERAHDGSLGKWSVGTSTVMIPQASERHSVEKGENSRQMQGVLTGHNDLCSTQNIVESQSNFNETLEPPCTGLDDFSEPRKFMGSDKSITESVPQILVQATQCTSELNQGDPVEEGNSRDHKVSVFSRLPGSIDNTGQSEGLDVEEVLPTQYLFTDMSDDSQESFDSGDGDWASENKWDGTEAFFGDEGQEEIQGVHGHEQSHLSAGFLRESNLVLPVAWNEKASPSQNQIAVDSTDHEDFVLRLSAAQRDVSPGAKNLGCTAEEGYLGGPSLLAAKVGQSLSSGSLGQSFKSTSPNVKTSQRVQPEVAHDPLTTIPQSGMNIKAKQQDIEVRSSLPVAVDDAYPLVSMADPIGHGPTGSSDATKAILNMDDSTFDENLGQPTHGMSSREVSAGPRFIVDEEEQLYPLIFHQRPPDRGQVLATCREQLVPKFTEEGDVYYGNVKDVSDRPTVMAGLIFDVKSRDAVHLRAFEFGGSSKRSKFEPGPKSRQYVEQEYWAAEDEMDSVVGIPSHFENDGRSSYLITPAKPPPSPLAVRQWASSSMKSAIGAEKVHGAHVGGGGQMFTMDANTGKLVPIVEIASAKNSQESLPGVDSSLEGAGAYERPASPKYDESYVLNLTALPTWMPSPRKPGASLQSARLPKEPSAGTEKTTPEVHLERPAVPSTVQTSQQQHLPPTETRSSSEEQRKGATCVAQDQQNKQSPRTTVPKSRKQWRDVSQMTAISPPGRPTPLSQSGFRDPASIGGGQQTTLMSIEVFSETRGELLPDPRYDAIGCIVVVICEDGGKADGDNLGVVLIRDKDAHTSGRYVDGIKGCEIVYLPDETGLLNCFARLVRQCDPDMLIGWEIQGHSLGLLAERAANLGIGLLKQLSRLPPASTSSSTEAGEKDPALEDVSNLFGKLPLETKGGDEPIIDDEWGRTQGSGLYVGGRIVLNLWRIMRGEVKLGIYTLEAVAEAVLRRRVPRIPWRTLTRWFLDGSGGGRFGCLEYFIDRARLNFQIMDQLDLINRTSELARVFGIDFYSVFSRGSQYRVESMMARLAHTQNYILVSPTRQQVADQPAMECLPLVMEPESRFYTSPVIVLDFQSLYPSMIIAYNLCFSTCLGKLVPDNPKILGVSKFSIQPGLLASLKECMTITPNGVMFVPNEVRPGVLPRLLQEILSTRIMVKKAMKQLSPDQKVLQRVLNARQFALKLIANVTYGYTAAGFSGRMPCAEIADSIVQCGRLTLERAIHLVNSHPRWGGRVVYGDTDSLFVLLEGRTREEAHAIGQEIAAAVTEMNPPPVALKMEKVYHPCVLLTKKRYVGYSYESATQLKPIFDAKGIETIRRDSCPAVAKALEHSLRTLFETQDLSQVKHYLQRQWGKILSGRVSLQDFIFAKEVRLGTYSSRSPVLPPAAIVASKAMAIDPRAEPRYAERIPYVVVHGEPGARLVDMVVDPLTLIDQPSLRLHDTYYITKQIIPACQRIFMLVGVDLKAWFSEMPRVYRPPVSKRVSTLAVGTRSTKWDPELGTKKAKVGGGGLKHGTIDQYYLSRHCTVCGEFTRASQLLCSNCSQNPGAAAILLLGRTARLERELKHLLALCRHCGGGDGSPEGSVACISLDCMVFFERRKVHRELQAAGAVALDVGYYPPCLPELF